jgi:Asp-tRNA(Asn)/Glu-tRNA(Gln) amidotransferase A subunit family amidase
MKGSAISNGARVSLVDTHPVTGVLQLSLAALRDQMSAGELSAAELMLATLNRVALVEPELHAFLAIDAEWAMSHAMRLDDQRRTYPRGPAPSPLWGVPVPVKDVEATTHLPTTHGSALRRGQRSQRDGLVSQRLRAAGAIVFGKTNTPAFAHKDTTDNLLGSPTTNPHDLSRTAGGSSGGAAAAVAAGVVHVAHGTDGAGSGRLPAAFCGVVGFKPSYGLIPRIQSSDLWAARSHHAILARTVDDARVAVSELSGPDARDPLSYAPRPNTGHSPGRTILQAGFAETFGFGVADDEVLQLCQAAANALIPAGIALREVHPSLSDPGVWFGDLWRPRLAHDIALEAAERPDLVEDSLRTAIELGRQTTAQQLLTAQSLRSRLYDDVLEVMDGLDVLLTPTMPTTAWAVDAGPPPTLGEAAARPAGGRWGQLIISNLTGWPAVSVPVGFTREGLPVGLQVMARWREDATCLQVAELVEQVVGGVR